MNFSVNNSITRKEVIELGTSVLTGKEPVLRDAKGRPFEPKYDKGVGYLTSETIYQHVDFEAEYPFTVTMVRCGGGLVMPWKAPPIMLPQ